MEKNFKYVLFDLDGTLLDTAPDFVSAINRLMAEEPELAKINKNSKLQNHYVSAGSKRIIQEIFKINEEHERFENLLKKFLQYYEETNHENTKPFSGIMNIVNYLNSNNTPWGVVTNKPAWLTESLMKQQDYLSTASVVVSGDTTPKSKPHPEPILHACKKIDVKPNEGIYVGDAERDIIAGNAAGMTTVTAMFGYIPSIKEARSWPADHYANSVTDLHQIISQTKHKS